MRESKFGCINWYLILKNNDILIEFMYIFLDVNDVINNYYNFIVGEVIKKIENMI